MKLTKDMFDELLVVTEECDSFNLEGLPQDEVISIVFRLAQIRKSDFDCFWTYENKDINKEDALASIHLNWGTNSEPFAMVGIYYDIFNHFTEHIIPLDNIPRKKYKDIELFNANFDENRYNK